MQENSEPTPVGAPKPIACSSHMLSMPLRANCEDSRNTENTPTSDKLQELLSPQTGNAFVLSSAPVIHLSVHTCTIAPSADATGGDRSSSLEKQDDQSSGSFSQCDHVSQLENL